MKPIFKILKSQLSNNRINLVYLERICRIIRTTY